MTLTPNYAERRVTYTAEKVVADLVPGDVYRFRGFRAAGGGWAAEPGNYRLVGCGTHVYTHQPVVVFVGTDGTDAGKLYVCGLEDWTRNFDAPERRPPEPAPVPEKVAQAPLVPLWEDPVYIANSGRWHYKIGGQTFGPFDSQEAATAACAEAGGPVNCPQDPKRCDVSDPVHKDPVHQDPADGKWYFYDETWSDRYGPYDSEAEARLRCQEYAEHELGL